MLANLIPEYLSLGIPIGLMLGILLAFRRLATSSELDVLRGVGMSFGRLLRVPYAFAFALALLNLAIVGFIQPYARYAYEGLQFDLRSGALGASIKVGEFTKLGQRMTLRIEESYNDGKSLRGIFVRGENKDGQTVSATASRGQFLATDDPNTIILRLSAPFPPLLEATGLGILPAARAREREEVTVGAGPFLLVRRSRGERLDGREAPHGRSASMWPRHLSRGERDRRWRSPSAWPCFNVATAFEPWRTPPSGRSRS